MNSARVVLAPVTLFRPSLILSITLTSVSSPFSSMRYDVNIRNVLSESTAFTSGVDPSISVRPCLMASVSTFDPSANCTLYAYPPLKSTPRSNPLVKIEAKPATINTPEIT